MRIAKYSKRAFDKVAPLLREGSHGWGAGWRKEVLDTYSKAEGEAYLAMNDGKIIGTIFLKREVRVLIIYFLAVTKKEREKGVGSSLVEFAGVIARREGRVLRVDVAREFERNAKFYARLGFKRCGRVKNFYMDGDEQIFLCKNPRR